MTEGPVITREASRELTLGELAVRFGVSVRGDPDLRVSHIASLESAGPGAVSFLANSKFKKFLRATRATAVVLSAKDSDDCAVASLLSANPYADYARIASLLHPEPKAAAGIHSAAIVEAGAYIDSTASVGAGSVIEAGARIGARAQIGPACIVQRGAVVGEDTELKARVTVCHDVMLGKRCIIHPGAVIGGDGFGFAPDRAGWVKVPQLGSVTIGDDVDIGANTTIDRGAIGDTVIANGVKLDNQIQIGHNVKIGEHTVMAACTGISGSTVVGKRCIFGGMVGMGGHLTIGDEVMITGCTMVSASLKGPGVYSSGIPAEPARRWRRLVARIRRLEPRDSVRSDDEQ